MSSEPAAPVSVAAPPERVDTAAAAPAAPPTATPAPVHASVTVPTTTTSAAPAAPAAPVTAMDARKGSRFAPTMTLAELRAGPAPGTRGGGGFGDRGGRGSSRGGRGSSPSNLAELLQRAPALPPTNQLQQQPVTMQQQQPPQQQRQQTSNTTHQPAPITSQQQGTRSFADIVAPTTQLEQLEAFGYIPPEVLAVVGIASGTTLPILPKSNAVRYDVGGLPFVTKATRNCDTAGAYLKEETGFKLAALRHATRAVIVRSNVVTDTPYIFLFDIAAAPPAGMVDSCITLHTLDTAGDIAIDGLPRPTIRDEHHLHLLQGTMQQLQNHASRVTVRNVVAGRADHDRIYEAVGVPKGDDWFQHLLGAPLNLVQEGIYANRRATLKPVYDSSATLAKRFVEAGEFINSPGIREHVVGCYVTGFNVRIVLAQPFTMDYKRFFQHIPAIASVYTDAKTKPMPARVSDDQPTAHEMDIAAATVGPEEVPLFAGLISTTVPPADLFQKIAAAIKVRLVRASTTAAVYACERGRATSLSNKTVSGWIQLTTHRHG